MISQRTEAGTLSLPASPESSNPPRRPRTIPADLPPTMVTTSAETGLPCTSPTNNAACPLAASSRYSVVTYSSDGGMKPWRAPVQAISSPQQRQVVFVAMADLDAFGLPPIGPGL